MQNTALVSTSLYVGDLLGDVAEGDLYSIFSTCGQITLIRVCRDALTRRSLGYAYVNYLHREDAEKARVELNNVSIKGRPCRVMWSQRDPTLRKSGLGNLFVKNLNKDVTGKALFVEFSQFGNVLSTKVALDTTNVSKGFGFVQYETQEMAIKAIDSLNNASNSLSSALIVQRYIPRSERIKEDKFTNIFFKNLDEDSNEEFLYQLFSEYGKIQNLALMKDSEGKSKCFGFSNYYEHESAVKAVEVRNGKSLKPEGKIIYVAKALRKEERARLLTQRRNFVAMAMLPNPSSLNLYVKNIDNDVTDEKLFTEFSKFGELYSARVMRDETGQTRGFGFVLFKNAEQGTVAMREMNGKVISTQKLFVDYAKKREGRRMFPQAQQQPLEQQGGEGYFLRGDDLARGNFRGRRPFENPSYPYYNRRGRGGMSRVNTMRNYQQPPPPPQVPTPIDNESATNLYNAIASKYVDVDASKVTGIFLSSLPDWPSLISRPEDLDRAVQQLREQFPAVLLVSDAKDAQTQPATDSASGAESSATETNSQAQ